MIYFATDGTFETFEDDITLIGSHEIHLSASLVSYPTIVTSVVTILPLEYVPCQLTIDEWVVNDVYV